MITLNKKQINDIYKGDFHIHAESKLSEFENDLELTTKEYVDGLLNSMKPLMVHSLSNTEAGGYQVPQLTAEDVLGAYNAVVAGRASIIIDKDDTMHAFVNQADSLNGEISIGILFYSYALLTYTVSGDTVSITSKEIQ